MKKLFFAALVVAVLVIVSGCGVSQTPSGGATLPSDSGTPAATAVQAPTFKTAGVPSELTFTRRVATTHNKNTGTGTLTQEANFKVTGLLKEIDPASNELTRYAQRAFEFEQGQLAWTLAEKDDDADTKCNRITKVDSAGKEALDNFNIPVGATSGVTGLSGYDLLLVYNETTSELSVVGSLLVPVDVTTTIQVLGQNSICNGLKATASDTKKDTAVVKLPIVWQNVNLSQGSFRGNLVAQEPMGNNSKGTILSGYSTATFGAPVVVTDITILGDAGPWNVSWDLNFLA